MLNLSKKLFPPKRDRSDILFLLHIYRLAVTVTKKDLTNSPTNG